MGFRTARAAGALQDRLRRRTGSRCWPISSRPTTTLPIGSWAFSGGTIVLAGIDSEPPLIFNRIAIGMRFDTEKHRVLLTQADISNGEIGVAGTGSVDYSGEPRLTLGFAGTPMSASALKRMWPTLIVPEVREWVIERVERGSLQRIEIGVNSPVHNLSRKGPPIPDDGLSVNIVASGVTLRPVDELAVGARCRFESACHRPHRDGDDRAGGGRYAGRPQAQHFAISCSRCRTWRRSPRRRGSNSGSTARCRRPPKSSPPTASANSPAP